MTHHADASVRGLAPSHEVPRPSFMDLLNQTVEAAGYRWKVLFLPIRSPSNDRMWVAMAIAGRTPTGGIRPWRQTLIERILRRRPPHEMIKGTGNTPEEAMNWLRHELRRSNESLPAAKTPE